MFFTILKNLNASIKYIITIIAIVFLITAITLQIQTHRYTMAVFNASALLTWIIIWIILKVVKHPYPQLGYLSMTLTIGLYSLVGLFVFGINHAVLIALALLITVELTYETNRKITLIFGITFIFTFITKFIHSLLSHPVHYDLVLDDSLELILISTIVYKLILLNPRTNIKEYKIIKPDHFQNDSPCETTPLLRHMLKNLQKNNTIHQREIAILTWQLLNILFPTSCTLTSDLIKTKLIPIILNISKFINPKSHVEISANLKHFKCNIYSQEYPQMLGTFFTIFLEALINALKYSDNVHVKIHARESKLFAQIQNSLPLNKTIQLLYTKQTITTLRYLEEYAKLKYHKNLQVFIEQPILNNVKITVNLD